GRRRGRGARALRALRLARRPVEHDHPAVAGPHRAVRRPPDDARPPVRRAGGAGRVSGTGTGFYGRDVAHVHDTGHGDYARATAHALLRRLHAAGLDGGLVVDLGCGSGIWARALLDAGFDVLGVDLSPDLLAIARERAPEARFVQASVLDAGLPPCAAVTAM